MIRHTHCFILILFLSPFFFFFLKKFYFFSFSLSYLEFFIVPFDISHILKFIWFKLCNVIAKRSLVIWVYGTAMMMIKFPYFLLRIERLIHSTDETKWSTKTFMYLYRICVFFFNVSSTLLSSVCQWWDLFFSFQFVCYFPIQINVISYMWNDNST